MSKKVMAASVSLVAIVACYTTFWIYQSSKIKSSIEQAAVQISKEVGRKNTEFFYASSKITGYPFNFTVQINQPKFISAGSGEKIELSSGNEPVTIVSNLFGSRFKVKLPPKIDIKQTIDEKEANYKLEFSKEAPEAEIKFTENVLINASAEQGLLPYLSGKLQNMRYSDNGYAITSIENNAKLISADKEFVQVSKTTSRTGTISSAYNIQIENMDGAALFAAGGTKEVNAAPQAANLWPVTASLDFSSVDARDKDGKSTSLDFIFHDANIKAASFGLGVKGDVKANGDDLFPFGDLSLKISNYAGMVDYFGGVVSQALANSQIPLFHVKSEKSVDFKKVLYEVATEKSNDDKDILLTISRAQGKSLFIGQKGLMEVIDLIKASADTNVPVQSNVQAAPTAPVAVPNNVAPSAGMVAPTPQNK